MMSETLYDEWLKPRLRRVIDAARAYNPDIVIFYHSCGRVTELIPHLIDAGIDVLNPVQPECMDFLEIHDKYGDRLSFHGTIGTQSVMPFGTPEDVRREVFKNLEIAGRKGGLYVCPTHLLEPEVPLENVLAYIHACEDYTS
jgi:uroporphyrinogen decarboxylase